MKSEQQIEQLEKELQELLQRVMQAPLSPLKNTVQDLQKHLDEVEDLVKEIRDVDLSTLSTGSQNTEKQIKFLKSSIESTPKDVQRTLQPLLQQELKSLENSHHANIDQLQSHLKASAAENDRHLLSTLTIQLQTQAEHEQKAIAQLLTHTERIEKQSASALQQTTQNLTEKISTVSTSVMELQTALAAQSQQASSSLEQTAQTLASQISEQTTSISKLQATLDKQAEQAASSLEQTTRDLAVKISTLAELATQQQTALTAQSEQISQLQQQQSEAQLKLADQFLEPMRRWLIAAASLAGAGVIGTVALAVRQFY